MKNYNAVLIGHGTMGKRHKERFESCGVQFVKILDLKSEQERDSSNADESNVDFVVIASPASTHYEYVKKYLERRVPVFVEKPLATNGEKAQELVDLAKRNGTTLFVAQSECYNPIFLNFRKHFIEELNMCENECSGKMNVRIEFRREHKFVDRCRDVNAALDLLVHDLSLFFTLFKYEYVQLKEFRQDNDDEARMVLKVVHGKHAGVEGVFRVNRNSESNVRSITASFPDAEYIVSLARYTRTGCVERIPDSIDNEHKFFFKLLSGACGIWGKRAAQNAADAVKVAAS